MSSSSAYLQVYHSPNYEYITFCILGIGLLLQIIVGLKSIKEIPKLKELNKSIKLLYYVAIISSLIFTISRGSATIFYCCIGDYYIAEFFYPIECIFYTCIVACLLGTLLSRLYYTFNHSIFEISKMKMYTLIICNIGFFTFGIGSTIILFIIRIRGLNYNDNEINQLFNLSILFASIAAMFYFIGSVFTSFLFVSNLFKLITLRQLSSYNKNNDIEIKKQIKLSEHHLVIIDQISRHVALLSLAIFTTILTMMSYGIVVNARNNVSILLEIFGIVEIIDVTINVICLYLQFSFAKKYYVKYCKCLQLFWKYIFSALTKHSMIKKSIAAHQNNNIHLSTIPSNESQISQQSNLNKVLSNHQSNINKKNEFENNDDGNDSDDILPELFKPMVIEEKNLSTHL